MKDKLLTQRRHLMAAGLLVPLAGLLATGCAAAHHGWSSFDTDRPLYLEGRAAKVAWRNPHVEIDLELARPLRLPADLETRALPAQSTAVDGPAVLARTALPRRHDVPWTVELAPLTRMQAWSVPEIRPGATLAVVGYTFAGEQGKALLRGEYLFLDGKVYGLRSSPA